MSCRCRRVPPKNMSFSVFYFCNFSGKTRPCARIGFGCALKRFRIGPIRRLSGKMATSRKGIGLLCLKPDFIRRRARRIYRCRRFYRRRLQAGIESWAASFFAFFSRFLRHACRAFLLKLLQILFEVMHICR